VRSGAAAPAGAAGPARRLYCPRGGAAVAVQERPAKQALFEGWRVDFAGPEAIRADFLDTFPYEYRGKELLLELETDEFTSVCPWSGLPDFGRLRVVYVPDALCIELKSFKYYLYSYRNVGIYYEHLTQRILHDLVEACHPLYMRVEGEFQPRGGIATRARAEYRRPGWTPQSPMAL
jgi:7-cyano-7-deazaguanine reductase